MSAWLIYALSGACWFGVGLWGVFARRSWIRRILATNVAGSGLFLIFIAVARRASTADPDPVPQALVLTGIVVAVSATAVALAVARRLSELERPEDTAHREETERP